MADILETKQNEKVGRNINDKIKRCQNKILPSNFHKQNPYENFCRVLKKNM